MFIMTVSDSSPSGSLRQLWLRISSPVVKRLRVIVSAGLTPKKLAQTLCIGTALGILPLLWGTTLICLIVAHTLKLNHVVLQTINYLFYPLQLVLLFPFFKLGIWLFPWGPPLPSQLLATLMHRPLSSLHLLGWITFASLAAWLLTVVPVMMLGYGVLRVTACKDSSQRSWTGNLVDRVKK
jgi:uncharacterized protein (DUF2062 family)